MRIIYLHQYFNTPEMRGSTRSYEIARRLISYGNTVEMVTTDQNGSKNSNWVTTKEKGIDVHWLTLRYSNSMTVYQRFRAFIIFAIKSTIKSLSLHGDVVYATSTPLTIAIPALIVSKIKKIPMVFEVRDLWPSVPIALGALKNPILRACALWLEHQAYSSSAAIVALSPGMKEGIISCGIKKEKIIVAPNSCDIEEFALNPKNIEAFRSSLAWLGDNSLILYTGTLGRVNDVGWLTEVAAETSKLSSTVRFLVVGDGAERMKIMAKAQSVGVLDRCFFMLPSVRKVDIPAMLGASKLTLSLTLPISALEANSANKFFDSLAASRPIAINYGGWQEDILKESGAGIRLERDPSVAAHQICDFISDDTRYTKAINAAFQLAVDKFMRDSIVQEINDLLEKVVKESQIGKRRRN